MTPVDHAGNAARYTFCAMLALVGASMIAAFFNTFVLGLFRPVLAEKPVSDFLVGLAEVLFVVTVPVVGLAWLFTWLWCLP